MFIFLGRVWSKFISFATKYIQLFTLFFTMVGVFVSIFLFYYFLIKDYNPIRALLVLVSMVVFVYVNKQY